VTQNHYYGNGQQAPVIIHDSGSSVFSNPWFWMSMQNQRQPQTVIQQYPAPVVQQAPAGEVIPQPSSVLTSSTGAPVVVRRDSGSGAITTIALIVLIVTVIVMGIALLKRRR
jgi:hypothetical protein